MFESFFNFAFVDVETRKIALVLSTLGIISTFFAYFYIFRTQDFMSLDVYKLTMLAISISFPIWLINSVLVFGLQLDYSKSLKFASNTVLSTMATNITLIETILIKFYWHVKVNEAYFIAQVM